MRNIHPAMMVPVFGIGSSLILLVGGESTMGAMFLGMSAASLLVGFLTRNYH